jgi:rare lipoprotein A
MNLIQLRLAGLLAFALFATPAFADPIADFFTNLFQPVSYQSISYKKSKHRKYNGPSHGNMIASYYGGGEKLNAHTATGERFNAGGLTAAHRTLPFGTLINVCFRSCAVVRVNDRGPASYTGRSLDLSKGAAKVIGLTGVGVGRVSVEIL